MNKCSECKYKVFEEYNGSPNRYYCNHPEIVAGEGPRMICRTERHSKELKLKTSPKWGPLKKKCKILEEMKFL